MRRHLSVPLNTLALLPTLWLAFSFQAFAQTAQPITSLPKPAADTTTAPAYNPPAQDDGPAAARPITSLPKPPQPVDATSTAPATAPVVSTSTAPPPVVIETAPPASSAPAVSTQPVPEPPPAPLQSSIATVPTAEAPKLVRPKPIRPFSTAAIAVNFGSGGIGVDLATPLAQHFNLRVGGSFFSYSASFNSDGIVIDGDLKFRSGRASLDYYPFRGGFRISPGVTFYNGNNLNATTLVPGGQPFSLGDANYYSSTTDPVHGTASFYLGKHVAPSITVGFGNMIPRSGRHVSFPFEIGFQYIDAPTITLNLEGTACVYLNIPQSCAPVQSDPQTQANLQQQEADINSDIKPLRFYPILSQGVSVRF
jgi:hypothetical protein